jgi:hypothetical protein
MAREKSMYTIEWSEGGPVVGGRMPASVMAWRKPIDPRMWSIWFWPRWYVGGGGGGEVFGHQVVQVGAVEEV